MRLDFEKWNRRRLELEAIIREIKVVMATPGRHDSLVKWDLLAKSAFEVTGLYMLRAELRGVGRLHATHESVYVRDPRGGVYAGQYVWLRLPVSREAQRARALAPWHLDYMKADPIPAVLGTEPEIRTYVPVAQKLA